VAAQRHQFVSLTNTVEIPALRILGADGDQLAMTLRAEEPDLFNSVSSARKGGEQRSPFDIPLFGGLIFTSGGKPFAVRAERQAADIALVPP
jgi:hypothetical protein